MSACYPMHACMLMHGQGRVVRQFVTNFFRSFLLVLGFPEDSWKEIALVNDHELYFLAHAAFENNHTFY